MADVKMQASERPLKKFQPTSITIRAMVAPNRLCLEHRTSPEYGRDIRGEDHQFRQRRAPLLVPVSNRASRGFHIYSSYTSTIQTLVTVIPPRSPSSLRREYELKEAPKERKRRKLETQGENIPCMSAGYTKSVSLATVKQTCMTEWSCEEISSKASDDGRSSSPSHIVPRGIAPVAKDCGCRRHRLATGTEDSARGSGSRDSKHGQTDVLLICSAKIVPRQKAV
ncbi:hypothetical protein FJTKL_08777 [Diaporthe vaccinii]|uniref:Uncharacterized protein n=1 Tax=Diaporthe vaccinii TaxID=105482 RepID=A0ABR4EQH0_9PEZI